MTNRLVTVFKKLPPAQSSNRFKWEERFWWFMTALVIFLDVAFQRFWLVISIVYIAGVSNYALVLTAASARQGAMAKEAALDNGNSGESESDDNH